HAAPSITHSVARYPSSASALSLALQCSRLRTSARPLDMSTVRVFPFFGVVTLPPVKFRRTWMKPKVDVFPLQRQDFTEPHPRPSGREQEREVTSARVGLSGLPSRSRPFSRRAFL